MLTPPHKFIALVYHTVTLKHEGAAIIFYGEGGHLSMIGAHQFLYPIIPTASEYYAISLQRAGHLTLKNEVTFLNCVEGSNNYPRTNTAREMHRYSLP